jgi:hypothetical protein
VLKSKSCSIVSSRRKESAALAASRQTQGQIEAGVSITILKPARFEESCVRNATPPSACSATASKVSCKRQLICELLPEDLTPPNLEPLLPWEYSARIRQCFELFDEGLQRREVVVRLREEPGTVSAIAALREKLISDGIYWVQKLKRGGSWKPEPIR